MLLQDIFYFSAYIWGVYLSTDKDIHYASILKNPYYIPLTQLKQDFSAPK